MAAACRGARPGGWPEERGGPGGGAVVASPGGGEAVTQTAEAGAEAQDQAGGAVGLEERINVW